MTTSTKMTFETIDAIFERLYSALCEETGERCPDTFVWFAAEIQDFNAEQSKFFETCKTARVGNLLDETAGWVYGPHGPTGSDVLVQINADATEEQVAEVFTYLMPFSGENGTFPN